MLRWGLSGNDSCDCGAEQTVHHITSGLCPIYRSPEGRNGIIDLDDKTRAWLESNALDMRVVSDGTRKKKIKTVSSAKERLLGALSVILTVLAKSYKTLVSRKRLKSVGNKRHSYCTPQLFGMK